MGIIVVKASSALFLLQRRPNILAFAADVEESLQTRISNIEHRSRALLGETHHPSLRRPLLTLKEDRIARAALQALFFRVWELDKTAAVSIRCCAHDKHTKTAT